MNRDNMRIAGYVTLIIALAVLVIFFDDIKTLFNGIMAEQTGSLMNQLLR